MRITVSRLPSTVAGALAVALGSVVIAGWYSGNTEFVQIIPGLPGMQFNTALGFVAAGTALLAIVLGYRWFAWVGIAWLCAVGLLTLVQYLFGVNLGIDQLLFTVTLTTPNPFPGRMGANTALCFVLVGTVLALLAWRVPFRWRLFLMLAFTSTALVLAGAVLLGHATSVGFRFGWGVFTQMALHTAAGFVTVCVGLLCAIRCEVGANDRRDASPASAIPRGSPAAWAVLIVSLVLSLWAWYAVSVYVARDARARFDLVVERMTRVIEQRLHHHEQMLIGAQGLFAGSQQVEPDEFHHFVEVQQIARRFPGMMGIGLLRRVPEAQRAAHIAAMRAQGFADYDIYPRGARAEYFPVTQLEPLDARNRRAIGFDVATETLRHEAMERARDSGEVIVSGKVVLVQTLDAEASAGFLMFAPVYRGGSVLQTVVARRARLYGFVYSPFRADELLRAIPELNSSEVALRVYDNLNPDPRALLFDADAELAPAERHYRPTFDDTRSLTIGDRHWMLRFLTRPRFDAAVPAYEPVVVLAGGVLVSLLLFAIAWSLANRREHALVLAEEMTTKLRESEQHYRVLADGSQGLICEHDRAGVLLYVNEAAATALGYAPTDMVGRPLSEFLVARTRNRFGDYLARVGAGRDQGMMSILTRSGEERVWKYDNALHRGASDERVLGHAQDVTEMVRAQRALRQAKEAAQEAAELDALTGLSNRRVFDRHLAQSVEHARYHHEQFALLFIDLDEFKRINDSLGHDVGDRLLRHVADVLRRSTRKRDLAARYGGDEFALVLGDVSGRDNVQMLVHKLTERLQAPLLVSGHRIVARFSLGVAIYPEDGDCAERLLQHADAAMYRIKQGRTASRV